MTTDARTSTIGELVARRPIRARTFERFGIDYCCGGKRSLEEACVQAGVDPAALREELDRSDREVEPGRDWTAEPVAALVEHILSDHHAYLHEELPLLGALVEKVARVHGEHHPELAHVLATYAVLARDLSYHMRKEELVLFPLGRQLAAGNSSMLAHCGGVKNPIRVLQMEHEDAGLALAELRRLTSSYRAPADACASWLAMLARLEHLERDLHEHVHEENNVLFPRLLQLGQQSP